MRSRQAVAVYRGLRYLSAACVALAALAPASAFAQAPENDSYFDAIALNSASTPLPSYPQVIDLARVDTFEATAPEANLGDGQPEFTYCDYPNFDVHYGRTVWWDVVPQYSGVIEIQAAGFDAVIGFVPFQPTSPFSPIRTEWRCIDDQANTTNEIDRINVTGGRSYSIQIGGFAERTNNGVAGDLSLADFPPPGRTLEARVIYFPNRDGDGRFDFEDQCPDAAGTLSNGCVAPPAPPPRPNRDGDALFDDGPDKCLNNDSRQRDEDKDGCLDLLRVVPDVSLRSGVFCPGGPPCAGLKLGKIVVRDIPPGTKVAVTCTKRACKEKPKTAGKRRRAVIKIGKNARARTKVTVKITKQGAIGRRVTYTVLANDFAKVTRCLRPGSKKPVRCTANLATRWDGSP